MNIGDTLNHSLLNHPLMLSGGTCKTLSDYTNQWLVLYFYPKDNTPGCTTEGLEFNVLLPQFKQINATVLGVSRDSVKSHDSFCAKQGFTFPLVSDSDALLCKAFDVIKEKTMYGRQIIGIERSTFLIGPTHRIVEAWRQVKVPGHAEEVLTKLKAHAEQ
ncbi:peroxiredoxin [Xylella fastidiosa subsp. morus]|jgi:peroxiredoxin Q/BCP|uniref:thioredoxin-dependent peroxiredoxin n=2 Tax=Xylella fastidiosa TaxID=2371 RepID=Q87AT1_XYLFT|nr:peroxiredoxin [Xylella fastidiosa]KAF0571449.1 peroxiredoxin [Xylella fastidiosa subsp. fastidiosa Mus-1]AAO29575.1 bacterioferritin comigratory protein [Xylella fastidiosa Temecula1]ACB93240.1 alkyl hydroperoxide reductase/ Thiol specific antioxidant/ Mal allergen [Xylella fastidiosa M23]AIC13084.1 peroxiredoxin [Xylella fastidiosa MUL0034]EGO81746.1 Peroxiredoxin Bcp [Xylella fastidiosa EB92.1]